MTKQPEALRLADALDGAFPEAYASSAADELRRLHGANQELVEALRMIAREDIIRMAREAGFADGVAEIVGLEGFVRARGQQ